jgi:hypothetical protein
MGFGWNKVAFPLRLSDAEKNRVYLLETNVRVKSNGKSCESSLTVSEATEQIAFVLQRYPLADLNTVGTLIARLLMYQPEHPSKINPSTTVSIKMKLLKGDLVEMEERLKPIGLPCLFQHEGREISQNSEVEHSDGEFQLVQECEFSYKSNDMEEYIVEQQKFGTVDVLFESNSSTGTPSASLCVLNVHPQQSIPLHLHKTMNESEMIISSGELELQKNLVSYGTVSE